MPNQTLLPIELQQEQSFSNFVVGDNSELLEALTQTRDAFRGIWIYGESSSGRSHLLRSKCRASSEASHYIGCADFGDDIGAMRDAISISVSQGDVVAIDDIGLLLGDRALEELVVAIYQRLIASAGMLIASHSESSLITAFALPDLGSRMRAMMNFAIKPLDDDEKAQLLRQRAEARGFKISDRVLHYWLSRGARDMTALLEDLETLDQATLERKQPLTVPLLKEVLGY